MVKYVYICSTGHSGSTLIDLLIGSHSRTASLGEISHLPKNLALNTICSCGNKVRDCHLWKKVLVKMGCQLGIDILSNPYALNLGYFKATTIVDKSHVSRWKKYGNKFSIGLNYAKIFLNTELLSPFLSQIYEGIDNKFLLYDLVIDTLSVDKIVDSSKFYLDAINLYQRKPEEVRIVFLVRDGRAVYYSFLKRGYSNAGAVNAWKNYYNRAIPLMERCVRKEHILFIQYENLVSDTATELRRLCKFLGLSYEEEMLDFSKKIHHITNGNNMRFAKTSAIRIDNTWENMLSISELNYFSDKAEKLNRRFGYE